MLRGDLAAKQSCRGQRGQLTSVGAVRRLSGFARLMLAFACLLQFCTSAQGQILLEGSGYRGTTARDRSSYQARGNGASLALPSAERPVSVHPKKVRLARTASLQAEQPLSDSAADREMPAAPESPVIEGDVIEVEPYGTVRARSMRTFEPCGAPGCDGLDCPTCLGGYSEIAPACTSVCPPGYGPLRALWYRLKVRAEMPLYWRRAHGPPALVTTSPVGTAIGVAGELGQPSTEILLGDSPVGDTSQLGMRFTFLTWLDPNECFGVQARYWNAGDRDDQFNFDSDSFPILARPFLNTTVAGSPTPDAQLIAFPNESIGNIAVTMSSSVDGVDLNARRLLYRDRYTRVDWLSGYKYVAIDEQLRIASHSEVTSSSSPLFGATIDVTDQFNTENRFHGGTYGLMSTRRIGRLHIEAMFRMGLGNLRRQVQIQGSTTTASGGSSVTQSQGLLARSTNSRTVVDDTFIIVPEVGLNLGWQLYPGLDFTVGYHYMLIPKVAQATRQLDKDLAVNLSDPLVGSLDPQLDFEERKYWLHSLGLGLQLRY